MEKMYIVIGNDARFNAPNVVLGYGRDIEFIKRVIKDSTAKGIKVSLCEQIDVNGLF